MCGVAGIFHYAERGRPVDADVLVRMTRAVAHRGPDGEGFHVDGPIGLGHRRLSIVDLSPTGAQPMRGARGVISYNGELYDHARFRSRLEARGYTFRGTSDTETLLAMLEEWGPDVLREASGIFAFAYYDGDRLILGRDPMGVKQLYYHDDGKRIVFASEIKALLMCPDVPRELDPEGLNQHLHFHTPLFDRTFFKGIKQVRAGEYLEVRDSGIRTRTYWHLDGTEPRRASPKEQVEELRSLFAEVVSDQLMSDVPVGAFFSGGIDSSAVAAFASRTGRPIHLFGVHFSGQGVIDEEPYQVAAAKALGLELDLITVSHRSFPVNMARLIYYQDHPVIGPAMIPMAHVSKLAASKVKVCLGGQAADELFAGYARYALVHPLKVASTWMHRRRVGAPGATESQVGGNLGRQLLDFGNLRRLAGLVGQTTWQGRYFANFAKVPERAWSEVFGELVSRSRVEEVFRSTVDAMPAGDPASRAMLWDVRTYLCGLFQQEDRMSMASGLESRVPFADPRIVRFAFHTGYDLKMRDGSSKWILRQAVADVLPELVLNRRKVGYDTPVESWMRGPHRDYVRDELLSSRARTRGFWDPRAIERLLADDRAPFWSERVWKLLSVEVWAKLFLDGPVQEANIPAMASA